MFSLSEMSPGIYGDLDTHYMTVPGGGFCSVAASIANEFEANIKLSLKVVIIHYEDSNIIISYGENGITEEVITWTALVTTSLGVLQAGTITVMK